MNYIIWKNEDSRDVKGLLICELPPITKPNMRVAETVIDGVDGSIIEELGYESYDKALSIGLTRNADIDEITSYFTGDGEILFSNEPDKCYKARIIGQIDYARLVRFRTATVVFRVQPYKYEYEEGIIAKEIDETDLFGFSKWYDNKEKLLITSGSFEITENSLTLTNPSGLDQLLYGNISVSTSPTDADIEIINTFGMVVAPSTQYTLLVNCNNDAEIWVLYYDSEYIYKTRTRLVLDGRGMQHYTFTTPDTCNYICLRITNQSYGNADDTLVLSDFKITKGVYVTKEINIENRGNTSAMPIIKIQGSGTVTITVNGNELFSYTFPEGEDTVIIDSQKQDAYLGATLKNRNMVGEFPILKVGVNKVAWYGALDRIEISSKSRWL